MSDTGAGNRTDRGDAARAESPRGRALAALVAVASGGVAALVGGPAFAAALVPAATPVTAAPVTTGYAEDFSALSAQARDFDHRPAAVFSYCARNSAVYECLSYGRDGGIRKEKRRAVMHGTAFAYRRQGGTPTC